METATRLVLLMHPMEWRREKCTTGRLACLNLANSEIIPGLDFDGHPRVRALLDDPGRLCALLYPGEGALDLSEPGLGAGAIARFAGPSAAAEGGGGWGGRSLTVFLIDATWACAKVIARRNPGLLALPRLMFRPVDRSRWVIKKQPAEWCLSTLEAIHELLLALDRAGLDSYPDRTRLLEAFLAMQDYQVQRRLATPNSGRVVRPARPC
jgi:DTW domain-containing protein YfiP